MKKLLLLAASGSIALSTVAQERTTGIVRETLPAGVDLSHHGQTMKKRMTRQDVANKGTAATTRWYNYASYFDAHETAMSSSVAYGAPYMWGSNNALMAYGDGAGGTVYDTVNFISVGAITDPAYGVANNGFNSYDMYPGELKITATNSFTIDSIAFTGLYQVNPAKSGATAGHVDTLRVTLVSGNGSSTANVRQGTTTVASGDLLTSYGAAVGSSFRYQYMLYNTTAKKAAGSPNFTYDILLDNRTSPTSWAADTADGLYFGVVPVSPAFNVPAGNMVGISVSFISGDPAFVPNDTVFIGGTGPSLVKYNMFRPIVAYKGTSTTPAWLTYNVDDRNTGAYASDPADGIYVPHWFWSAGTSAATNQYPDISFRVGACSTCGVVTDEVSVANVSSINKVGAFPNPASGVVSIGYILNTASEATVTITNMLGQVVATKHMVAGKEGVAVFNTNNLADGLYTYSVSANGERSTGRISVAH